MYLHRVLSVAILVTRFTSRLAVAQCTALSTDSSADDLIAFLRSLKGRPAETQNRECIQFALEHLEHKPSPDAIAILIDYVDWERPVTKAEQEGFSYQGSRKFIAGTYVASSTLFSFGKVAIPALVSAIKTSESPLIRRNATYTTMMIFRAEPVKGIELLRQEAQASSFPAAANLRAAALSALEWCYGKNRPQCEAAAHGETR